MQVHDLAIGLRCSDEVGLREFRLRQHGKRFLGIGVYLQRSCRQLLRLGILSVVQTLLRALRPKNISYLQIALGAGLPGTAGNHRFYLGDALGRQGVGPEISFQRISCDLRDFILGSRCAPVSFVEEALESFKQPDRAIR